MATTTEPIQILTKLGQKRHNSLLNSTIAKKAIEKMRIENFKLPSLNLNLPDEPIVLPSLDLNIEEQKLDQVLETLPIVDDSLTKSLTKSSKKKQLKKRIKMPKCEEDDLDDFIVPDHPKYIEYFKTPNRLADLPDGKYGPLWINSYWNNK